MEIGRRDVWSVLAIIGQGWVPSWMILLKQRIQRAIDEQIRGQEWIKGSGFTDYVYRHLVPHSKKIDNIHEDGTTGSLCRLPAIGHLDILEVVPSDRFFTHVFLKPYISAQAMNVLQEAQACHSLLSPLRLAESAKGARTASALHHP